MMTKNNRSRKNRYSIIIFCFGVLLLGMGVGISFVEYSDFKFGGKIKVQANSLEEKEIQLNWSDIATGDKKEFHFLNWSDHKVNIVVDKKLSDDKVVFNLTYPKECYSPVVREIDNMNTEEELSALGEKIWVYEIRRAGASEMERFMRTKEVVLKGLKEKVYYSYEEEDEVECTLRVSENNLDKVFEHWDDFYE